MKSAIKLYRQTETATRELLHIVIALFILTRFEVFYELLTMCPGTVLFSIPMPKMWTPFTSPWFDKDLIQFVIHTYLICFFGTRLEGTVSNRVFKRCLLVSNFFIGLLGFGALLVSYLIEYEVLHFPSLSYIIYDNNASTTGIVVGMLVLLKRIRDKNSVFMFAGRTFTYAKFLLIYGLLSNLYTLVRYGIWDVYFAFSFILAEIYYRLTDPTAKEEQHLV
mmetsp:Transcript_43600/g.50159  ORF Transcript_43600/g.50159 Transcript_43600/m.50159 type:complete len:221 (-) Transcript_43600:186-848(-)